MGEWIGDKPYDFAIVVYDGKNTADEAFEEIKNLENKGCVATGSGWRHIRTSMSASGPLLGTSREDHART